MRREVLAGERTTDRRRARDDPARQLTLVELLAAALGHRRQRCAEIALHELAAREAIGMIDRPERAPDFVRSGLGEERGGVGGDAALAGGDDKTIARVVNGVL